MYIFITIIHVDLLLSFALFTWCSTTMSAVDFERMLEGGRDVEIWVMELWGVFHSSLLMIDVGPSWPPI